MRTLNKCLLAVSLCALCGCANVQKETPSSSEGSSTGSSSSSTASVVPGENVNDSFVEEERIDITGDLASQTEEDFSSVTNIIDVSTIKEGKSATISEGGTYLVKGENANAKISVEAEEADVTLIFQGVNLACADSAPLKVKAASSFTIRLASKTKNYLSDGTSNEDDGALISKKDAAKVNIEGAGYLYVTSIKDLEGKGGAGIKSPLGISIKDSHLIVNATDHAIQGTNGVEISNAKLYLDAKKDGIHTGTDGAVTIKDSVLDSSTYGDGIDAGGDVTLENVTSHFVSTGTFLLYDSGADTTGELYEDSRYILENGAYRKIDSDSMGRYQSRYYLEQKCKGVKSEASVVFKGGDHYFKTVDDCIASDTEVDLLSGDYSLYTSDQGINSDQLLKIGESDSDFDLRIYHCFEGVQGGEIHFNSGYTYIYAEDDGINAASDTLDSSAISMNFHDGSTVYVNAEGDGVDSNGSIAMDGGNLIVAGPSSGGNGSLDFDGSFTFTGGNLLAVGSNSMAQVPDTSKVNALSYGTSSWSKGATYSLYCGEAEFSIVLPKNLQSVSFIVESTSLTTGSSVSVVKGATIGGDMRNGVYFGKKNSFGGSTLIEGEIKAGLTTIGTSNNHPGGGPGGGGPGGR